MNKQIEEYQKQFAIKEEENRKIAEGCAALDSRRARMDNQISGTVRVVEIDYPYFCRTFSENGECVKSHGPKRTQVTICWDGGGESVIPFPITANPGDQFTFTIRPTHEP